MKCDESSMTHCTRRGAWRSRCVLARSSMTSDDTRSRRSRDHSRTPSHVITTFSQSLFTLTDLNKQFHGVVVVVWTQLNMFTRPTDNTDNGSTAARHFVCLTLTLSTYMSVSRVDNVRLRLSQTHSVEIVLCENYVRTHHAQFQDKITPQALRCTASRKWLVTSVTDAWFSA